MKIKTNQIVTKVLSHGLTIERVSANALSITGGGEIPVSILLPEDFELQPQAVQQLVDFAHTVAPSGKRVRCACATPDFHKGSTIPVGSVVVCDHDMVIPGAIGTDINCGMRLHHTGLGLEQFLSRKKELISLLSGDLLQGTRDLPTSRQAMTAMFTTGLAGFWQETQKNPRGMFTNVDYHQVMRELDQMHYSSFRDTDARYAPENLMNRDWMRDPTLGTLGGSNHFCEFQVVEQLVDRKKAYELGIKVGQVMVMIHTGSRDVGFYVGNHWMDIARQNFPTDRKHPANKAFALEGELAKQYLDAMTVAAHYASVNRALIAEVVRQRIRQLFPDTQAGLVVDVPHNIIIQEDMGNVHRKGATPAHAQDLLLIPGSMGHQSYLLQGMGNETWLKSASHGAGRSFSRNQISFRGKKDYQALGLEGVECITLKEERKIEEAPRAYKDIGPVIQSQVEENTVQVIAVMSPLTTFKA